MNKQLTKKTIGIAASAALMASLAVSGSALANGNKGGNKQGPKTSISVYSTCAIVDTDQLDVSVTITDNNAGIDEKLKASLESVEITGYKKFPPKDLVQIADWKYDAIAYPGLTCEQGGVEIGTTCTIPLAVDVCAAIVSGAKALEAQTDVKTGVLGNKETYTSFCKDSDLKIESFTADCNL